MSSTNVKCIYCGNEFLADSLVKEVTCEKCNKTFSTTRGAKYYSGISKVLKEEKKVAYGEMFDKAEWLITEGEFYIKNEDYATAEEKFKQALEITTVDKRIYIGLVKVYTKNFTDYEDVKHYEYLKKAIDLCNKQEKDEIRVMYKAYYQMRSYTPEEMAMYNEEELKARVSRCEELLKDGIPSHYKTAKDIKFSKVFYPIALAIGVILLIISFFLKNELASLIITTASVVFLIIGLIFIMTLSGGVSKTQIYDFALDFFDAFDSLNLEVKDGVDAFDALEILAVDYLNGSTPITLENDLSELLVVLANSESEKANEFIKKYKIANKLIKEMEEE